MIDGRSALHHLALVVADLARAERFYVGVLGLPILKRHADEAGRPRSVWLALDDRGGFLALERAAATEPTRSDDAPGLHCLAFRVEAGARTRLRAMFEAAGHPVVRETAFTFYVRDPDGVLVGLSHYPEPAHGSGGGVSEPR